jgi:hypothetical protein
MSFAEMNGSSGKSSGPSQVKTLTEPEIAKIEAIPHVTM